MRLVVTPYYLYFGGTFASRSRLETTPKEKTFLTTCEKNCLQDVCIDEQKLNKSKRRKTAAE